MKDPICSPLRIEKELEAVRLFIDGYINQDPKEIKEMIEANRTLVKGAILRCSDFYLEKWGSAAKLRNKKRLWDFFRPDRTAFETFAALGILSYLDVLLPSTQNILH